MSFLSPNQQCQSTQVNSKHWLQPVNIIHWPHPFFTEHSQWISSTDLILSSLTAASEYHPLTSCFLHWPQPVNIIHWPHAFFTDRSQWISSIDLILSSLTTSSQYHPLTSSFIHWAQPMNIIHWPHPFFTDHSQWQSSTDPSYLDSLNDSRGKERCINFTLALQLHIVEVTSELTE